MAKSPDASLAATDFLTDAAPAPSTRLCALVGDDPFLTREVLQRLRGEWLGDDDGEFSLTVLEGPRAELRQVLEEVATVAMFGGERRLVVVDDADDFVTRYRTELEEFVARGGGHGVLVLVVHSLPSNTRLYKAWAGAGLLIDCRAPTEARLARWIVLWARRRHQIELSADAAEEIVETIGPLLGLIDQELAKLALAAGADRRVGVELVRQMVGGWRAKSAWEMLDAALNGNAAGALRQLDRLLRSGEQPIALLAQISSSLRRLAAATRMILRAERAGRRVALRASLERAGVKSFVLGKVEPQLRRLGRQRGQQLYQWLLEADLDLKGASQLPPTMVLERLVTRLAAPAPAKT